jgi:hypothetical protein
MVLSNRSKGGASSFRYSTLTRPSTRRQQLGPRPAKSAKVPHMSRPNIRKALRSLRAVGMVEQIGGRGRPMTYHANVGLIRPRPT